MKSGFHWQKGALPALAAFGCVSAAAEEGEPVVVEMYVSQACEKSPPAAEFQAELSRRPDIVALTFHVDYWNVLANPKHGRWQDPFAEASFSARQRIYNRKIRGRGTVFTPQAIINGAASEVGTKRDKIENFITEVRRAREFVSTQITRENGQLTAVVETSGPEYHDVWLVKYRAFAETSINAGDNFGMRLREHHIVRDMTKLGIVTHEPKSFVFPVPPEGMGCAVIVQEQNSGPILGGRYCP
jgi:hypothetical protein